MVKIQNFDSFGGCVLTFFAPINVKFGMGERTCGQRVAPAGRKTHFWTTE